MIVAGVGVADVGGNLGNHCIDDIPTADGSDSNRQGEQDGSFLAVHRTEDTEGRDIGRRAE